MIHSFEQTLHFAPPEAGSLERWAYDYVLADDLEHKLAPPALPERRAQPPAALRLHGPSRPGPLKTTWDKYKAPKTAHALRELGKRAHLLHTFLHHELQAAELMCWAVLAFPQTPTPFVRGLLAICADEIRHMGLYRAQLGKWGFEVGAFPVRDWFWERAPSAQRPEEFLALMGLGFEAGNLDHSQRFEQLLREAGDDEAAALLHLVGEEEISHVAFAAHWFEQLTGKLDFETWCAALPAPLSPWVMRGRPLARARRRRAGLEERFLERLEAWQPASRGG